MESFENPEGEEKYELEGTPYKNPPPVRQSPEERLAQEEKFKNKNVGIPDGLSKENQDELASPDYRKRIAYNERFREPFEVSSDQERKLLAVIGLRNLNAVLDELQFGALEDKDEKRVAILVSKLAFLSRNSIALAGIWTEYKDEDDPALKRELFEELRDETKKQLIQSTRNRETATLLHAMKDYGHPLERMSQKKYDTEFDFNQSLTALRKKEQTKEQLEERLRKTWAIRFIERRRIQKELEETEKSIQLEEAKMNQIREDLKQMGISTDPKKNREVNDKTMLFESPSG